MKKKEYIKPEALTILIKSMSLLTSSPFIEPETTSGPGLGNPDDFDDDEPGL